MADTMWIRCPECGNWCFAEKKGIFGRLFRSFKTGDKELGEFFGEAGDIIGMKGLGKTAGRLANTINAPKHGGEMLNGDSYHFCCDRCGCEWGTDDERYGMSKEHSLYISTMEMAKQFLLIKNRQEQDKNDFTRRVQGVLAEIENTSGIDDAKATMYDVLACCYYFFFNDSQKALLEINKSLALFDDEKSHVLKGLFMKKGTSPTSTYDKMRELLKINDCNTEIMYVDRETIMNELEHSKRNYENNFLSIPENQRKFLVITSEYTYLPDSFKILKYNNTDLSGVIFENGFPNNNAIYVCHPYKPNVYFSSESYQVSLFKNQLNEFRELLQCLGAKSIKTENQISSSLSSEGTFNVNGKVGGEYKGINANVSAEAKGSNSVMKSMVQKMLIDDEFSFNPTMSPFVPEGLVWYEHMEEWQRLARMRLRGQNKYSICISTRQTNIVNENEANLVNADLNALIAKGDLQISKSTELKVSEENSHEWKLVVEFYPLSEYENKATMCGESKIQLPLQDSEKDTSNNEKRSNTKRLTLVVVVALLLLVIGILMII